MSSDISDLFDVEKDLLLMASLTKKIDFMDLIEDSTSKLKDALSECHACGCLHFDIEFAKDMQDAIKEARQSYECSSEASSALVSLSFLNPRDASKLIIAENIGEMRNSSTKHQSDMDNLEYCFLSNHKVTNVQEKPHEVIKRNTTRDIQQIRMSLAFQSTRKSIDEPFFKFLIPTNFELLEDISPMIYLDGYCWICEARLVYYQKEITKTRDMKENILILQKLFQLLSAILMNTLTNHQFSFLTKILELSAVSSLENKQMFNICAVAERLFFFSNLSMHGETAIGISKGYQEMIDFKFITRRFKDYKILEPLKEFLKII